VLVGIASEGFLSGMKRSKVQSKKPPRAPFDSASLRSGRSLLSPTLKRETTQIYTWGIDMQRTISSSDLRAQIKRVLNEVGYGKTQYIVEKFGEPTAAIISIEDFRLLQAIREQRAAASLQEIVAGIRSRAEEVDAGELDDLIEEARAEFYSLQSG